MERQLELLSRYLSSNFAACQFCARLAELDRNLPQEFEHHRSISALFSSCTTCALCLNFIQWLPRTGIQKAVEAAQAGLETRLMVRLDKKSSYYDKAELLKSKEHIVSGRLVLYFNLRNTEHLNEFCSVPFAARVKEGRLAARPMWDCTKRLTFMNRCRLIRSWLEECRVNHMNCKAGPNIEIKLPVRLVGISQLLGKISIRLVSVTELGSPRYVALSHCWGDPGLVLSTTKTKLADFNRNISIEALPRTFHDAVHIAHAINIQYLWIDSLCIVQDDPYEWAQEAAKMASIFQNAYLTICAAGAHSCKEGCGLSAQFSPAVQVNIPLATKENSVESPATTGFQKLCVRHDSWRDIHDHFVAVTQFPIHSRGWIFQETLLSRRLIYFTPEGQFYWQCCSLFESEDGILHSGILDSACPSSVEKLCEPLDHFDKLRNDELAPNIWNEWMCLYFHREFSIEQDRMPALAGTTLLYKSITGDMPVVGMWKRHLPLQLGWRVRSSKPPGSQLKPPPWSQKDTNFSSWSIFSIKNRRDMFLRTSRQQVKSEYLFDFECEPVWQASILDTQVTWTGEPLVSTLKEGVITTRKIVRALHGIPGSQNWRIALDDGEIGTIVSRGDLYVLLLRIGREYDQRLDQFVLFQLLTQRCGEQQYQHTYRRVGYLETSCMFKGAGMPSELLSVSGDQEFRSNKEMMTYKELIELPQQVVRLI